MTFFSKGIRYRAHLFIPSIITGGQAMIVIPRKVGESIIINDEIIVTVIEIRGDKVRLAIDCPPQVPVHKREVFEAIRQTTMPSARPR